MTTKKLISSTFLYGIGDLLVMAVGGFLLIPLYTRTLTQEEYGVFAILRTNTDILTYIIHFGLISAISRLYFDYKRERKHYEYLSSVLVLFFIVLASLCAFFGVFGQTLWGFLSPQVSSYPYLLYCLTISTFSFFSSFVLIWLRIESKVRTFVCLQVFTSVLVLVLVVYVLLIRNGGLAELLWTLLASSVLSALALPLFLLKKLKFRVRLEHVSKTLHFALPIVLGYFAYFLINRGSMVVLQRYVSVEQVAVFGLSQQIAAIVVLASGALAKTLQPVIYGAEPKDFAATVEESGRLFFLMMAALASLIVLFSAEILTIAAPQRYASGYYIFVLLILTNFIYSLNFVSNSVLLYYKLSAKSVIITVAGGLSALTFNLILVPRYELYGAAISMMMASFIVLCSGFYMTQILRKSLSLGYVFFAIPLTVTVTLIAFVLHYYQIGIFWSVATKAILATSLSFMLYHLFRRKSVMRV